MERLGSRVSVSASFQFFALTSGGKCQVGKEIVRRWKRPVDMSEREMSRGKCPTLTMDN